MAIADLLSFRSRAEKIAATLPALQIAAEDAVRSILHGEHRQGRAGMGEKFWQFREYFPGDRPQDIDWRQSAKTDRVFIRQKEWQTAQNCYFWCSSGAGMDYKGDSAVMTKGEAGKILNLALAILMIKAGEHIGAFGDARTGRSTAALEKLGLTMINNTQSTDLPPADSIRLSRHAHCVLAGDFLAPLDEIEKALKPISAQSENAFILQILDPSEITLPFEGRCIFRDMGANHLQERIDNVGAIRDEYHERIAAHLADVQEFCRKAGWGYILHRTDMDITTTLRILWLALAPHDPAGAGRA